MKSTRQEKILELIARYEIETQDDLIEKLRHEGFDVTQATASRDIKELKLTKTLTNRGKYRYIRPTLGNATPGTHFSSTLAMSIVSVDYGENIVVVKTYSGMANAVATGIDAAQHSEMLGCVAGDDTILIVAKSRDVAVRVCEQIKSMIKNS